MGAATDIFSDHWTKAAGVEVLFLAHNSVELLSCACARLQADFWRAEVLEDHAVKLQAYLAALKSAYITL